MSSPKKYEISQVIQRFLPDVEAQNVLSGHQRSILKLISICKTSALGGHRERCLKCNHSRVHYNSCGNRNCPSCQGVSKQKWIFNRRQDLIPVKYFHCVFTIPSELYIYFRYNKKLLYDLMMLCVKETLMAFGQDPKSGIDGNIGGISILHTWTQQMTYHPHLHCIVPGGGLRYDNTWRNVKGKGDYLFPVKAMSSLFRGKLLAGIHAYFIDGQLKLPIDLRRKHKSIKNLLYKKKWVVYAKKAFGGPEQVLEYLGRYTHKICISNYRIIKITDTHVTFRYLDRKAKKARYKKITGQEFIKLFAEHILPKRFVRIRHFGFLCSRTKAKDLAAIRKSLKVNTPKPIAKMSILEFMLLTTGKNPYLCPICNQSEMVITKVLQPIRGSPVKKVFPRPITADRIVMI